MAVPKRDIEIVRGDDYAHQITFTVQSGNTTVPVNITGRTYTAQLRKVKSQAVPDETFTTTITDGVNGELLLSLTNADTAALCAGCCYYWDLQQNAAGVISTIMGGKATVSYDVTR